MAEDSAVAKKKVADRSPRYPSIPLKRAIDRAREFYRAEGKHAAQSEVAVTHWGYTTKSSGGKLTLAALRAYGLLENVGGGVKLSDRALRIIVDEREPSPERTALIREAALAPAVHRKLWDRYKADLPSQASLRHTLLMDFEFADNAVNDFIREYRETLAFASLDNPDLLEQPEEANSSSPLPISSPPPQVGDLVNGEAQSVLQVPQPAFSANSSSQTMVVPPIPSGFKQDVFTLSEGDVILRWPDRLSQDSFYDFKAWLEVMEKKIARSAGVVVKQDEQK